VTEGMVDQKREDPVSFLPQRGLKIKGSPKMEGNSKEADEIRSGDFTYRRGHQRGGDRRRKKGRGEACIVKKRRKKFPTIITGTAPLGESKSKKSKKERPGGEGVKRLGERESTRIS